MTTFHKSKHCSFLYFQWSGVGGGGDRWAASCSTARSHHPEEPAGKRKHFWERPPLWTWRALRVCDMTNGFIYMQSLKGIYWITSAPQMMNPALKASASHNIITVLFPLRKICEMLRVSMCFNLRHYVVNDSVVCVITLYLSSYTCSQISKFPLRWNFPLLIEKHKFANT